MDHSCCKKTDFLSRHRGPESGLYFSQLWWLDGSADYITAEWYKCFNELIKRVWVSPWVNHTSMGTLYTWLSPRQSIKTKQLAKEFQRKQWAWAGFNPGNPSWH